MSLQTPNSIRRLQRKLYVKAKAEPDFRFYLLYDKIYREDILLHAYNVARANDGAPGVDGIRFAEIESQGLEDWLSGIRNDLRAKTYRPQPVRRVLIPKHGGGERPLGIPTIRDRVVQTAAKLVVEPIFEADFEPTAYGYRPRRSAVQAVRDVNRLLKQGYTDVVEGDLSKYFDSIPHAALLQSVARRIVDRHMLRLIKMWLKAPVEETDGTGKRRLTGGKTSRCGTPQGGVISPVLANLYMNRFLKYWRLTDQERRLDAKVIAYADDFVILTRGHAAEAKRWTQAVMTQLGLTLNDTKTKLTDVTEAPCHFLGYSFGPCYHCKDRRWYVGGYPSKQSVARLKGKVNDLLYRGNPTPWPDIRDGLNRMLRGWTAYYNQGTRVSAYQAVDNHVLHRVRHFLVKRHKDPSRGTRRFTRRTVFGELGVLELRRVHLGPPPCARREVGRKAVCGKSARPV